MENKSKVHALLMIWRQLSPEETKSCTGRSYQRILASSPACEECDVDVACFRSIGKGTK